jgi:hypothetical protein
VKISLKTIFWDILSVLPLTIDIIFDNFWSKIFLIFIYINIAKIEVMFRKLEDLFSLNDKKANLILIFKLVFHVFLVAHIFACTWSKLGFIELEAEEINWISIAEI